MKCFLDCELTLLCSSIYELGEEMLNYDRKYKNEFTKGALSLESYQASKFSTIFSNYREIFRFLVKNGANVAAVNSEGEIPSDLADEDDNQMKEYLNREVLNQGESK